MKLTSSEEGTLSPVHGQQTSRAEADTLSEVDTAPEIHSNHTSTEAHTAKVEDSGVANIRQATQMCIFEGFVDRLVQVTIIDFVGLETGQSSRDLCQLAAKVHALLVGALGGGGQGGELDIDLVKKLGQLAVVEGAGVVLVILHEEAVQAAKMVGGLRESLLDSGGDVAPFGEG